VANFRSFLPGLQAKLNVCEDKKKDLHDNVKAESEGQPESGRQTTETKFEMDTREELKHVWSELKKLTNRVNDVQMSVAITR